MSCSGRGSFMRSCVEARDELPADLYHRSIRSSAELEVLETCSFEHPDDALKAVSAFVLPFREKDW